MRARFGTIARVLEHSSTKTPRQNGTIRWVPGVRATESTRFMERAMGIEPTSEAWEAYFKASKRTNWRHFCVFRPLMVKKVVRRAEVKGIVTVSGFQACS